MLTSIPKRVLLDILASARIKELVIDNEKNIPLIIDKYKYTAFYGEMLTTPAKIIVYLPLQITRIFSGMIHVSYVDCSFITFEHTNNISDDMSPIGSINQCLVTLDDILTTLHCYANNITMFATNPNAHSPGDLWNTIHSLNPIR